MLWSPNVMKKCKKAVFVPNITYYYCFNPKSITNTKDEAKNADAKYAIAYVSDFVNEYFISYDCIDVSLFGMCSLWKSKKSANSHKFYFFNFPLLKIDYGRKNMKTQKIVARVFCFIPFTYICKNEKRIWKICGIPLLKIKYQDREESKKYYILGIPVIKVTRKKIVETKK